VSTSGGVRVAIGRALAVNPSGFRPTAALRAALGVTLPFAIGIAVHQPIEGSIAAAGAVPGGVASMIGGGRRRIRLIIATSISTTSATFVGGLVAGHLPLTLIALVCFGFAAGIVVSLGQEASIVGIQAVVGLAVFGRFPGSVAASSAHAGFVLAGGALQALIAALVQSPQPFTTERRALATAYRQLADLAADTSRPGTAAATSTALAADLIARRAPSDDVDLLRGLTDEAARIRLELHSLESFPGVPGTKDVTIAARAWLRSAADWLQDLEVPLTEDPALARAVDRLRTDRARAPAGTAGTGTRYAAARAAALLGQLRAVDRLLGALAGVRWFRFRLRPHTASATMLRLPSRASDVVRGLWHSATSPQSPAFRHAVRLAVMLPIAEEASHLLPGQRGYWVTLTVVVVLKPDYAATVERGLARVLGTGLGVVLAGLLIVAVHPLGALVTVLVALLAWTSYLVFSASYALYSFALTSLVVMLLSPTGGTSLVVVGDRGLDTLAGGVIAMIGYAVWPTWEGEALPAAVSRLFTALADYCDIVLAAYVDPSAIDRPAIDAAASGARRARVEAMASLDRALAEPSRARSDTERAASLLASARRIVIALHALRTTVEDAEEHSALPEVDEARQALTRALQSIAAGQPSGWEGLREQQERLADRASDDPLSLHARRLGVVAAHLDPLVDSIDTAAHVGSRPAQPERLP
jgi:uncharacterized membrane protein YccC